MLKLLWAVYVECLTFFGAAAAWGRSRQLGWSRRGVVVAKMAGELELGKKRKEKEKEKKERVWAITLGFSLGLKMEVESGPS